MNESKKEQHSELKVTESASQKEIIKLEKQLNIELRVPNFIQEKITELSVPIIKSISEEQIQNFKFFNERHYEDYCFVYCNKQEQNEDMGIRLHTNKLIMLCLAQGNDIMRSSRNIVEIDFIINKGDRSKVNVRGKRKLGARQLHPETIICKVKLEGEEEMRNIRAGVTGYLIEINELIKQEPNLLKTQPKCDGFLAIVMPKGPFDKTDLIINNPHLIKEETYLDLLKNKN